MSIAHVGSNVGATSAKINELIDAINAATAAANSPRELDYNEIITPTGAFTAIVDVAGLSVTFTLAVARTVHINVFGIVQSNVANDRLQLTLADPSNTVLTVTGDLTIPSINSSVEGVMMWRKQLSAGSYTYKVRANRQAGTGTSCIVNATGQRPAFIQALDVT